MSTSWGVASYARQWQKKKRLLQNLGATVNIFPPKKMRRNKAKKENMWDMCLQVFWVRRQ
jgi:hypothetical protein